MIEINLKSAVVAGTSGGRASLGHFRFLDLQENNLLLLLGDKDLQSGNRQLLGQRSLSSFGTNYFFAISFASYLLSANGPMQNACTLVSKFCFRLNKLGPIIKYQTSNTIEYILVPTCLVESKKEKN